MMKSDFDYLLVATFMDRSADREREVQYSRELKLDAERKERQRAQVRGVWQSMVSYGRQVFQNRKTVNGNRSLVQAH